MNFRRRAELAWQILKSPEIVPPGETKDFNYVWPTYPNASGVSPEPSFDYPNLVQEGYNLNSLIFAAIYFKARQAMTIPLRAYSGDYTHRTVLPPDSDIQEFLTWPNPHQSWSEFHGLNTTYFGIAGNAFIFLDQSAPGTIPQGMYPIRPDRIRLIPQPGSSQMMGYLYVPEGVSPKEGIPILPEDMIHIKIPNPGDPYDGAGFGYPPILALAKSGDVDNKITDFLKNFFDRGVMLPGIVQAESRLDEAQIALIRARWRERYGGVKQWGDVGVLGSGAKYQRIGLTFDEMGFETLDERNETRILGPLGVPPILLSTRVGLARSTYSNYFEARRAFWEDTFVPEMKLMEAEYNKRLRTANYFVAFDYSKVPALQKNMVELVAAAKDLWTMGVPTNQALVAVGLDIGEVPHGDKPRLPAGIIPVERVDNPPTTTEGTPTPDTSDESSDQEDQIAGAAAGNSANLIKSRVPQSVKSQFPSETKTKIGDALLTMVDQFEGSFKSSVNSAFKHDRGEVLRIVQENRTKARMESKTPNWLSIKILIQAYFHGPGPIVWSESMGGSLKGVLSETGQFWIDALGQPTLQVGQVLIPIFLETYTMTFADQIAETSLKQISTILEYGTMNGWTGQEIENALSTLFDVWISGDAPSEALSFALGRKPTYRTEQIVRTELMRAMNSASEEVFKAAGAHSKEWLATGDDRTRKSHVAASGQIVPITEKFEVGGYWMDRPHDPQGPPHEIVGCRCTILPKFD